MINIRNISTLELHPPCSIWAAGQMPHGYHGYWTKDLTKVNPAYGTEDRGRVCWKAVKIKVQAVSVRELALKVQKILDSWKEFQCGLYDSKPKRAWSSLCSLAGRCPAAGDPFAWAQNEGDCGCQHDAQLHVCYKFLITLKVASPDILPADGSGIMQDPRRSMLVILEMCAELNLQTCQTFADWLRSSQPFEASRIVAGATFEPVKSRSILKPFNKPEHYHSDNCSDPLRIKGYILISLLKIVSTWYGIRLAHVLYEVHPSISAQVSSMMLTTSVDHISSNVDALPKSSRNSMRFLKHEIHLINPKLLFCMLRLQALWIAGLQPWEPDCVARAHAMAVSCQHSLNILGHTILRPLFLTLVICTTLQLQLWHWKVFRHQNSIVTFKGVTMSTSMASMEFGWMQQGISTGPFGATFHAVWPVCVAFLLPAGISWIISLKPGRQFQPTMRLDVTWWDMSNACWTGKMTSTRYVNGFVSLTN